MSLSFARTPPRLPPPSPLGVSPGTTIKHGASAPHRQPTGHRLPTAHQPAAHTPVVAWLGLGCACFLALHQLRFRMKRVNDLYLRLVGPLLRPHEIRGLPGAFWFMLGAAIAVALFPRDVALQRCGIRGAGPSVSFSK